VMKLSRYSTLQPSFIFGLQPRHSPTEEHTSLPERQADGGHGRGLAIARHALLSCAGDQRRLGVTSVTVQEPHA
jgi:hypothetical protein